MLRGLTTIHQRHTQRLTQAKPLLLGLYVID